MRFVARARDVLTPTTGGAPVVLAEDAYEATVRWDRTITAISAQPERPSLGRLVGERGGGKLRHVLSAVLPEERAGASPLYLILDDLSGASLVANFAWILWHPDWMAEAQARMNDPEMAKAFKSRENVCIGHAPGATALSDHPRDGKDFGTPVPDLRNPGDPEGWHAFTDQAGAVGMRRARRIDLRLEDGVIRIDSAFQDSATAPAGGRAAVHEYTLTAAADRRTLELLSLEAQPRILPFPECPSATANLVRLIGTPLPDLRETVLTELAGVAGCTHLNDALRALAEAPALVTALERASEVQPSRS